MVRVIICGAAAVVFMALLAPIPTQAAVANPGLTNAAPAGLMQATRYYRPRYRYSPRRYYWHGRYWRHRYRHCWNTRVYRHGRSYWVRRCGWRYY